MGRWAVRIAVLAAVLAGAVAVDGCDPTEDPAPPRPFVQGELDVGQAPPHYVGRRPVSLVVGQPEVGGGGGCEDDTVPYWVCDPLQESRYRRVGEAEAALLREARMDVADGGTSWTLTVRFDGRGRRVLADLIERARDLGGVVLVLADADAVLLSATVPEAAGGRLRFTGLTKSQAWDTVELVAAE